ncbi:hypothetical protein Tco_0105987 [Tanacetum coccineum]
MALDWAKQGVWAYMIINSLDEAKAVIALSGMWLKFGKLILTNLICNRCCWDDLFIAGYCFTLQERCPPGQAPQIFGVALEGADSSLIEEISRYCSVNLYAVSNKEDTAYLCLHFTNHEGLKSNTPYPEDSIRRIEDYLKILEDIERGPYSKKPPIRCGILRRLEVFVASPIGCGGSDVVLTLKIQEVVTETMTKLTLREYMEEVQENYGSNTTTSRVDKNAKINVFKRKIRVGNDKVVFKSDKPISNIIKRVYALSLRERMKLDLEARLMGEALILNRSLDPLYGDYIELNDLNEPLELRRNQVDDLELTIEEGEVVDEPLMDIVKTRCDNEIIDGLDEYPSYCDFDRKIHIDCAYNLQFSCMIGYEYVNANFFPLLSINVMSKNFYNSIMKDKVEYKGKNIVGAFMNVPIFVGNFSVVTNFAVVENIDSYRDEGMGDIIVGRPFYKDAYIKARRFDGMITI